MPEHAAVSVFLRRKARRCGYTVVVGVLLALSSAGAAAADGWPLPGDTQVDVQSASLGSANLDGLLAIAFGSENVQGNGVSAAVAVAQEIIATTVGGEVDADGEGQQTADDASVAPVAGGGAVPTAIAPNAEAVSPDVPQSSQPQQPQAPAQEQPKHDVGGQAQTPVQTVRKQQNHAEVIQKRRPGTINVPSADAVSSATSNPRAKRNAGKAIPRMKQPNPAHQSQSATQGLTLGQSGSRMRSSPCGSGAALVACVPIVIRGEKDAVAADAIRIARRASTDLRPQLPLGRPLPSSWSASAPEGAAVAATTATVKATGGHTATLILILLAVAGFTALPLTVAARRGRALIAPAIVARPTGALARTRTRRKPEPASAQSEPEQDVFDSAGVSARSELSGSANVGMQVTTILVAAEETARQIVAEARAAAETVRVEADTDAGERRRAAQDNAARITASAAAEVRALEQSSTESRRRLEAEAARHEDLLRLSRIAHAEIRRTVSSGRELCDRLEDMMGAGVDRTGDE